MLSRAKMTDPHKFKWLDEGWNLVLGSGWGIQSWWLRFGLGDELCQWRMETLNCKTRMCTSMQNLSVVQMESTSRQYSGCNINHTMTRPWGSCAASLWIHQSRFHVWVCQISSSPAEAQSLEPHRASLDPQCRTWSQQVCPSTVHHTPAALKDVRAGRHKTKLSRKGRKIVVSG